MCQFYCIAFIEYGLAEKTLVDYTKLFFLNEYNSNDKIMYKYFKDSYNKRKTKKKIDETTNYLLEEIKLRIKFKIEIQAA